MNVTMNHAEKILFTWSSMFSNAYYGETHDYLFGTKGTVMHDESEAVSFFPQGKQITLETDPLVNPRMLAAATAIPQPGICRISLIVCAAGKSPSVRLRWVSARPLRARWPWLRIGRNEPFAGTLRSRTLSERTFVGSWQFSF